MAQGVQMTQKQIDEMRRLRKEGGYTVGEIAKAIGCSQFTVSKYIGHDGGRTRYKIPDGVQPTANLKIVHQQMTIQGNNTHFVSIDFEKFTCHQFVAVIIRNRENGLANNFF